MTSAEILKAFAFLFLFMMNVLSSKVKAVKLGHVLVIDEADKAPTNVTCILKTLVENGEMILADGRRIVASEYQKATFLSVYAVFLWCQSTYLATYLQATYTSSI